MRVLFDQGVPVPLRRFLTQHEVTTAYERGWAQLKNGNLLDAAEGDGFATLVTTDTNLKFQQNLSSRHHRLSEVVAELREALLGWKAYFGIAEVLSPLRDLDKWIRRKLRCYHWKQWGRAGYRELRRRGVSVRDAWNTFKSAHGPWRLSQTPALVQALPARYFTGLGLPSLAAR